MNYFDRQFLRAQDLADEQDYQIDRLRRHNRYLVMPGVAHGLLVNGVAGATSLTVDPGTAIDALGCEIVVTATLSILSLPGAPTTKAEIYIVYQESPTDPSADPGVTGNTRISETASLAVRRTLPQPADPLPSGGVLLAEVLLDGNGHLSGAAGNPNNSVSLRASARVDGDIAVTSLTLKLDSVPSNQWPRLSCSGPNQAALDFASLTLDDQREVFFQDRGQIRSFDDSHRLVFNRQNSLLELHELGAIRFLTGGPPPTEKMRILAGGNVGIGTATPAEPLEVNGRVKAGALSMGPWPNNPNNYAFVGANTLDQTAAGNYALLQGIGGADRGVTFLNSPDHIAFRIGNIDRATLTKDGNLGVGATTPSERLQLETGSFFSNGENQGVIVDSGGVKRVGLMKYPGKEGMLVGNQALALPVRLGRWNGGTIQNPTTILEDLVVDTNGNVGIGTSTPGVRLDVNGGIRSTMWNVVQLFNSRPGPITGGVQTGAFTTAGGALMIFASGSGFSTGVGPIGIDIRVDGFQKGQALTFANEINSHKAFASNALVVGGIAAGSHTITLLPIGTTQTDINDHFSVTVLELPFTIATLPIFLGGPILNA
jgi:hypothetical protein